MAELCFDCLNETMGGKEDRRKYVYSDYLDLCEGCGQYKKVVLCKRGFLYYIRKFRIIIYPLMLICFPLILIYSLCVRLYCVIKFKKYKKHK